MKIKNIIVHFICKFVVSMPVNSVFAIDLTGGNSQGITSTQKSKILIRKMKIRRRIQMTMER